MMDLGTRIGSWIGVLLFVGALFGGIWLHGYTSGKAKTERVWQARLAESERAARRVENELIAASEASAKRVAAKEAALHEQAKRQGAAWRETLASLPRCRVPRSVGVQLDAAAGVPAAPPVAEPPRADPDAAALDRTVELAVELDRVRENYAICAANVTRLTEAKRWYTDLRERVNSGDAP